MLLPLLYTSQYFNPRLPCGRRRLIGKFWEKNKIISIHASLAGGDVSAKDEQTRAAAISIHASLAGGDGHCAHSLIVTAVFQSTPPLREATSEMCKLSAVLFLFQSTPPLREATRRKDRCMSCPHHFNPRLPCGRRPRFLPTNQPQSFISIHASLAGGDRPRL